MVKRKTGSIYIITLVSSIVLVAMVLGLSYLLIQFRGTTRDNGNIDRSYVYAELGIRHALYAVKVMPNWRSMLNNGAWLEEIAVDGAAYSVSGTDPADNNLGNNNDDPVLLSCTASLNGVSRTVQVQAASPRLDILGNAVTAGAVLTISDYVRIYGDVSSNANVSKSGSYTRIYGNVEAVGSIYETRNIFGSISPGSTSKLFPDRATMLNYYQGVATTISYRSVIQRVVLSHLTNPFGSTNPQGVYYIPCQGQRIILRNCRIVGTLILDQPRNDSIVEQSVNWQPARTDYPALIVNGGALSIQTDRNLSEPEHLVDFSLPGEVGYGLLLGTFSNTIQGAIYADGALTFKNTIQVTGPVIATGPVTLRDNVILQADADIWNHPPVSFRSPYLLPVYGTWQEVVPP